VTYENKVWSPSNNDCDTNFDPTKLKSRAFDSFNYIDNPRGSGFDVSSHSGRALVRQKFVYGFLFVNHQI